MSGFKTILVPFADASAVPPLEAALGLAAQFSGHVIGLHVRIDPALAVPLVGEGMSGAMVEEMMSAAERQAATRAVAARTLFDHCLGRSGLPLTAAPGGAPASAEWVDVVGREEEAVAWRGRLADLVALARPDDGADSPSPMTLNAALMDSGRPLLLVPPGAPAFGRHVAIAWNGSAEAGRAVAAALPLLERAGAVSVLSVAESDRATEASAEDLIAYLAWHGIDARLRKLRGQSTQAGEALIGECREAGADMLVMGAYTHSRLRQLILGGVTRHVLHHAPMTCLMCH